MTLPASGQISFNDLRGELGVSTQSPFSIASASAGTYATININSPDRPNSSTPHAISEWYSYNHNYTCTVTQYCDGVDLVQQNADCSTSTVCSDYGPCGGSNPFCA